MFEKELDRVRKQLKQLLATPHPYVSLETILANEQVHPAYRMFFRAEVDWWVHEERAIRSSNPRFATGHADFRELWDQLDRLYIRHSRFDHEELNATIEAAAKTRLNFLCRPRTTLKWFVYRGEPTKPLQEILLRLGYLYDNRYLVEGFEQWARARGTDTSSYEILSVVEFERIIEKIDNDAILDLSQQDFVGLLDNLFEFFATANPELPPESVPTEAVIIFLDDKGAVPISQALERLLYREELRYLTRTKLIEVIDDVILALEDSDAAFVTELPPMDVFAAAGVRHDERTDDPEPVVAPGPVPVVMAEAGGIEERTTEPVVEEEAAITTEAPVIGTGSHVLSRLTALGKLLDERTRDKVRKKLFVANDELYERVVLDVLDSENWKAAAGKLDRFFAEQGIEPNSVVAMEFCQAIHKTFI